MTKYLFFLFSFSAAAQVVNIAGNPGGVSIAGVSLPGTSVVVEVGTLPEIELQTLKGFPTLYGDGSTAITGGRGGIKFFITSTGSTSVQTYVAASGGAEEHYEGTLLGALSLQQDRQIIPRVSGNINGGNIILSGAGYGDFTYHGHLAPEGGLAHTNAKIEIANADNWIVRYLTSREGIGATVTIDDQFSINRCDRVAIDHCSFGWFGDEAMNFFPGTVDNFVYEDIIIQRTIFGNGRDDHNVGLLVGAYQADRGDVETSIHLNFFPASQSRTPEMQGEELSYHKAANNVVYNWVGRNINAVRNPNADVIGYYFKAGPRTVTPIQNSRFAQYQDNSAEADPSFYIAGNYAESFFTDLEADNRPLWTEFDHTNTTELPSSFFRGSPLASSYTPITALETYATIITDQEVGNNRSTNSSGVTVFGHDSVDEAYFTAFNAGTDSWLPEASFTHPTRASNTAYPDTNWNGIDDDFETAHGITASTDVILLWELDGYIIRNTAGYNAFEIWSAYKAGMIDMLAP